MLFGTRGRSIAVDSPLANAGLSTGSTWFATRIPTASRSTPNGPMPGLRDFIITAFTQDLGYDRFVREQVAGDAIGEGAATGFLITSSVLLPGQIGADEPSKRLARQDALDEIVINVGQTFLGMSIGCARCHDHKFDPIAQREYYSMQAFFAGVEYGDRELRSNQSSVPGATSKKQLAFAGIFRKPDIIHA